MPTKNVYKKHVISIQAKKYVKTVPVNSLIRNSHYFPLRIELRNEILFIYNHNHLCNYVIDIMILLQIIPRGVH